MEPSAKSTKLTLYQQIHRSILNTANASDGILVLLSPAINISQIIVEYLAVMKPKELMIFVGLEEAEIQDVNRIVSDKIEFFVRNGMPDGIPPLIRLTSEPRHKRRQAYIQGGFYNLSAQVLLLDLLSKGDLPPQLITKVFFRGCQYVQSYKEILPWINHLIRVEGDNPHDLNKSTQTVVISQRVVELSPTRLENIYRFFGLKKVILWPFGHETIIQHIKSSPIKFQQFQHTLKMNENEVKINTILQQLMKYCCDIIQKDSGRSTQHTFFYKLFTEQKEGTISRQTNTSHPLLQSIHQIRSLMFQLTNYPLIVIAENLSRWSCNEKTIWDTSNEEAANKIKQLNRRTKGAIFQYKLREKPRQIDVKDLVSENKTFSLTYDIVLHKIPCKKAATLFKVVQETARKYPHIHLIWIHTSSRRLSEYLTMQLHAYLSGQEELHQLRSIRRLLELERSDRVEQLKYGLSLKRPQPKQQFEINQNLLLQQLLHELNQLLTPLQDLICLNCSRQQEQEPVPNYRDILTDQPTFSSNQSNISLLSKKLENLFETLKSKNWRYVNVEDIARQINPKYLHYTQSRQLRINTTTIQINHSQIPAQYNFFQYSFQPSIAILYNSHITLLQYLYLSNLTVGQVHSINYTNALEDVVCKHTEEQENRNFWEAAKRRTTLPAFNEDFRLRIAQLKEFSLKGKSMLRYGTGQAAQSILPDKTDRKYVIIDKREYKAPLPGQLYFGGLITVPVMLQSGDYILSDMMAVERKAVSTHDIHQSLASGRLENQLKTMSQRFRFPYLLVEYPGGQAFSTKKLNYSFNYQTKEIYNNSVRRNILRLLRKFPQVKLIWSSSPQQTVQLFLHLKKQQLEPNVQRWMSGQKDDQEVVEEERKRSSFPTQF